MSDTFSDCKHLNQLEDQHEGTIVCTDCGLVISEQLFTSTFCPQPIFEPSSQRQEILEILERLNLSKKYVQNVEKSINEMSKKKKKANQNILLAASVYDAVNRMDSSLSLRNVTAVSGVSGKKITSLNKSIHILKSENILEKYCKLNNLEYKDYSVIKEKLSKYRVLGHNPLTLVGSMIYMHCKEYKIKNSMKSIAQTLGISTISIQRYIKNEFSYRC